MNQNVTTDQYVPRIAMAAAAAIGAAMVPKTWVKTGLFAAAAGLIASVATGYCPITAAISGGEKPEQPHWRTIKTYQVQA